MSRNAVAILVFTTTVVLQCAVVFFVVANRMPEFYQQRLSISQDALAVHGAAFEEKMDQLQRDTSDEDGDWSIELSDEQINGWLAVALPRRYPQALPKHLHEPRIAIESDLCHVACQYRDGATRMILTLCLDLTPAEKPNELKLKVLSAKIGAVPGLEDQAVWPIAQAAHRSKIRLRWVRRDVQPEAIVQIPRRWLDEDRQVHIEDIEFRNGRLYVSGKSSVRPQAAKNSRTVATHRSRRIE